MQITNTKKYNHSSTAGKEEYSQLEACLRETLEEVKNLQDEGLTLNGKHYDIEWLVIH